MEIRDTPGLCGIGDGVLDANAPDFNHLHAAEQLVQRGRSVADRGGNVVVVELPTVWIFKRETYRSPSGKLEPMWVREK